MRRTAIIKCIKAILKLRSFLRVNGKDLAYHLARHLGDLPPAPREVQCCYRPLFAHFNTHLTRVQRTLERAEDAYVRDKTWTPHLRQEQENARESLYRRQSRIRQLLAGLPDGPRRLLRAGITGSAPQAAPLLTREVKRTIELLRDIDPVAPELIAVVKLDATVLIRQLQTRLDKLTVARTGLQAADVALATSQHRVNEAIDQANGSVRWVAGALEGLCHLAAEHRLAERIRSVARG